MLPMLRTSSKTGAAVGKTTVGEFILYRYRENSKDKKVKLLEESKNKVDE